MDELARYDGKKLNWRAIEQKNPHSRSERRIKRQEQARASRETGYLYRPVPRYVSARAIVEPVQVPAPLLDPELARIIGEARTLTERRQAREATRERAEQVSGCGLAPERPPPE